MYSQNDEEKTILAQVERLGLVDKESRFLDIGAYDPFTFSNTRALYERGWSGVMVEPSPSKILKLLETYGKDPRIMLVNAAIAERSCFTEFYDSKGDAVSTLSPEHQAKWSKLIPEWDRFMIRTIGVKDFFAEMTEDFDFISVDVEGTNFSLITQIPWEMLKTRLVCVEYEDRFDDIMKFMKNFNFDFVSRTGENLIVSR